MMLKCQGGRTSFYFVRSYPGSNLHALKAYNVFKVQPE
jgi:hypothetical protein